RARNACRPLRGFGRHSRIVGGGAPRPRSLVLSERSPMEAIFFAALEMATAAQRAAFLDEACAGDEALRRRVERLLAAHPRAGDFLERPVVEAANVAALAPPHPPDESAASGSSPAQAQPPEYDPPLDFLAPS